MMKKTLIATALMAASTATVAEISGNVALTSDYVFRGFSQTDRSFAIQGGFDYAHDSGLYVGTWASNVDSTFFGGNQDPQIELDLYVGYSGEFGEGVGYDVGYLRYEYPGGGSDYDTNEIYGSLSYMGFTGALNYSDELNFIGSDQSALYFNAGYGTELPWYGIGFSAAVGYSFGDAFDVSDSDRPSDSGFYDTYTDWSIGLSKSVYGVDLGLTYTDVDMGDKADCDDDICDTIFAFSISKSL